MEILAERNKGEHFVFFETKTIKISFFWSYPSDEECIINIIIEWWWSKRIHSHLTSNCIRIRHFDLFSFFFLPAWQWVFVWQWFNDGFSHEFVYCDRWDGFFWFEDSHMQLFFFLSNQLLPRIDATSRSNKTKMVQTNCCCDWTKCWQQVWEIKNIPSVFKYFGNCFFFTDEHRTIIDRHLYVMSNGHEWLKWIIIDDQFIPC